MQKDALITVNVRTLSPNSLACAIAWAFLSFFFPFDFSTLLSSSSLLLLLSPACNTKARSPLESSVPCLATRTLDDEIRVQRSPSVGWLSKLGQGDRGAGWATALCWGDPRKSNGKLVLVGVLMLAAVLTLGRLEAHSWWNGCCSVCPFSPTIPTLWSFFTILLFSLAFPICAGTGRSACTPVQAVVSPNPSSKISYVYWSMLWLLKGFHEFCNQCNTINATSSNILISIQIKDKSRFPLSHSSQAPPALSPCDELGFSQALLFSFYPL